MKASQLNHLVRQAEERKLKLVMEKGEEYTKGSEDRLSNFKRIGATLITALKEPEQSRAAMIVWLVYFQKHVDAVTNFILCGQERSSELVEHRIDDLQVYLDLLRGLVQEHKNPNTVPEIESSKERM